jgi:hypothetical protein
MHCVFFHTFNTASSSSYAFQKARSLTALEMRTKGQPDLDVECEVNAWLLVGLVLAT